MNQITFGGNQENKHRCEAEKEGQWVVFRCPHCADYERRIHVKTGEMISKSSPENTFLHTGSFMPLQDFIGGIGVN